MKKVLILVIAVTFMVGAASSSATYLTKATQAGDDSTLTDVKVCPINGDTVTDANAPNETYGKYKIYFCCAHHKQEFDGLSDSQKEKKVLAAIRKQVDNDEGR
ncbi:MAG TPA: hypothetical protein VGX92_12695 [Pyrinomonadaceae bacterium]|jgi:uncharacterized protein YxeA|nr:hypothetical protein [Pyrinomonadaceae bacterium]